MTNEPVPAPSSSTSADSSDRTLALVVHLLGLFTWIIGPLVLWLVKKDESTELDWHGKEAVNFQITITLACVALMIVTFVLAFIPVLGWILITLLYTAFGLGALISTIIAAIKANEGKRWMHPVCIRFIK